MAQSNEPINIESAKTETNQPTLLIQRIYVKDASYEAPNITEIFQQNWNAEVDMKLEIKTSDLGNDTYEVVLVLKVTAQSQKKVAFLIEIEQAGLFLISNFPKEQLDLILKITCPTILFPYARELITDLSSRGTFPPLYLAPVNFEAFYKKETGKNSDGTVM